uniref:Uncharacterized protein n=1 Tax=Oscillatoriales cyanobacterium SpSt-418 TaxID=2282169 RepID=A0A7C3PU91_9CYAN
MLDDFEKIFGLPEQLEQCYCRSMELCPGVWLDWLDWNLRHSWLIKVPAHSHLVQILVLLSGLIHIEDLYPTLGGQRSYFSRSGISPSYMEQYERSQRIIRWSDG